MNMPPEEWLAAYCLGWTQGEKAEAAARFEAVRAVIVEGQTARAAARRHAIDPRTIRKMIAGLACGCVGAQGGTLMADSSAPLGQGDESGAVHGLRCAPPVAASLGPVGAEVAEVVR
ncbi:MAG: hypothetical protein ACK462_01985 [Planctomyces sp.]|jgi:hypothetical protein